MLRFLLKSGGSPVGSVPTAKRSDPAPVVEDPAKVEKAPETDSAQAVELDDSALAALAGLPSDGTAAMFQAARSAPDQPIQVSAAPALDLDAAKAEGAAAERARIKGIVESEAGQKRPRTAMSLALSGVAEAAAIPALEALPEEAAKAPSLGQRMTAEAPNPSVGAGGDQADPDSPDAAAKSMLAAAEVAGLPMATRA